MSRFGLRHIATLIVAIAVVVAVVACDSDEDPLPPPLTGLPEATTLAVAPIDTAAPTTVPTMAASTQLPASTTIPVPARTPISIDELEITEGATLRHVIAALSDDEVRCVQGMIGAEAFNVLLDVPLSALPQDVGQIPTECLSDENVIGMSVAFLSRDAGGLDAETRSCVRDAAASNPSALGLGPPPGNPQEIVIGALMMQLCLSDEEAAALALDGENELPPPSALRCLAAQLGGTEALLLALAEGQDDPNTILEVMLAAHTCEPGQTTASSP